MTVPVAPCCLPALSTAKRLEDWFALTFLFAIFCCLLKVYTVARTDLELTIESRLALNVQLFTTLPQPPSAETTTTRLFGRSDGSIVE